MNRLARARPLLGTLVEVSLAGAASDAQLLALSQLAFARVAAVQRALSCHDPDSELSRLNRSAHLARQPLSTLARHCLSQALRLCRLSGGLFDPSLGGALARHGQLPDHGGPLDDQADWRDLDLDAAGLHYRRPLRLDLGGIAKGQAVDLALAAVLAAAGRQGLAIRACVNAGGDLRMSHWQGEPVAIRDPKQPGRLHQTPMQDAALATSSHYYLGERRAGIYAPERRAPAQDRRSYSVFAPSCWLADALTKVCALSPAPQSLLAQCGARALILS